MSVIELTLPDARIATVPVPLKLTQVRQAYIGADPEAFNAVFILDALADKDNLASVTEALSIVHTVPEPETVISPLSPSLGALETVPQDVEVPSVVRNLPLLPV